MQVPVRYNPERTMKLNWYCMFIKGQNVSACQASRPKYNTCTYKLHQYRVLVLNYGLQYLC